MPETSSHPKYDALVELYREAIYEYEGSAHDAFGAALNWLQESGLAEVEKELVESAPDAQDS
jgi:hypothetical protein